MGIETLAKRQGWTGWNRCRDTRYDYKDDRMKKLVERACVKAVLALNKKKAL
jgi:predicted Zn-dependent protease